MGREHLIPKQITREDGSVGTYWVNPGGRSKAPLAAVALSMVPVAAMGLAACSPDSGGPEEITSPEPGVSQPVVDPVETATPEPEPELRAGDVLEEADASKINSSWGKPTDDRAYQMPSGEYVLLKGGEPLPANVSEAATQQVLPSGTAQGKTSKYNPDVQAAFDNAVKAQEEATGRKIAVVLHAMNSIPETGGEAPRWSIGSKTGGGYNGTSREEALAVAQRWVDQSPGTRAMIVVDALQ